MANTSLLIVQKIQGRRTTTTKDSSAFLCWPFVMLGIISLCLMLASMAVTTTVGFC